MPPTDYRNLSLTTDASLKLKALTTLVVDTLGHPVSFSGVVCLAADLISHNPTLIADAAARVFDQETVTVHELARRLGLPDHEAGAVGAWTGAPWGTVWTEAEAAELIKEWRADATQSG